MVDVVNHSAVAMVSKTQQALIHNAAIPRVLMGGTKALRKARETFLPKEEAESDKSYLARVGRSFLFNAFTKTVADMTGKVFAKEIALKDNVPAEIKNFAEDIDLTGRHINLFAHDAFHDGLQAGGGYILTDMPPSVVRADGATPTLADEQAAGLRPFLVYIPVENLIGWKSKIIAGVETLTMVRIKECVTEPHGEFGEKEIEQIKVLEPGKWTTYRKNDKGEWPVYMTGTSRLFKITLVPFYANRTGFMTFAPPLEKLADLNIAHWQLNSDIANITHFANVPILFGSGLDDKDQFVIGPTNMFRSGNSAAQLKYVEHSGAAIGTAMKRLANLELQMQAMGLQLLIDGPGGQTATGERRDDEKENSPLAQMARALGDALEISFGFMAEYIGLGADNGGEVEVNTDYGVSGATADLQYLTAAALGGKIDNRTYIEELKRRKTLGESVDVEVVLSRIESEAPELDGVAMDLADPKVAGAGGA